MMSDQPLFTPYRMGDLDLPNLIVMAPLTRMHAQSRDHVATALQAEYYAQRASAGLIITEATAISPEGFGWADTPGLWTEEQVRGWRGVTDAVHAAGGRIIAQLWHTAPNSHPELLDGAQPVSASNVDPGQISVTRTGRRFSGNGRPAAWIAADVVRFEDGLLAEHWDVLQDQATHAESVSGLPMFGDRFAWIWAKRYPLWCIHI
jgi:N-ethylmaleimide reductase